MLSRNLRFALLGVLCLCGILAFNYDSMSAATAEEKALMALDDEWSKAASAKNLDKVVSFYAEEAMVYPPNEPAAKGREGARKAWSAALSDPNYNISWKTVAAGVDGKLGWTAGTYEDSMKGADGKVVKSTGKYLCVWKKGADGKWQAIQDMWNTDAK